MFGPVHSAVSTAFLWRLLTPYRTAPSLEPTSTSTQPLRSGRTFSNRNWSSEMENEWEIKSAGANTKVEEVSRRNHRGPTSHHRWWWWRHVLTQRCSSVGATGETERSTQGSLLTQRVHLIFIIQEAVDVNRRPRALLHLKRHLHHHHHHRHCHY